MTVIKVRLADVVNFDRGLTYSKADEVEKSNTFVLRANNIDLLTGELVLNDLKYLRSDFEIPEKRKVKQKTLLMCMSSGSKAHLGKVALVQNDIECGFGGFLGCLTASDQITIEYLFLILRSPTFREWIDGLADGSNINNLTWPKLSEFEFLLPSVTVQNQAVDFMNSFTEINTKLKSLIQGSNQEINSLNSKYLAHVFEEINSSDGIQVFELGQLVSIVGGGTPSKANPEYWNGSIPWVTVRDLKDRFLQDTEHQTTQIGLENSSTNLVPKGTVVIATRVALGKVIQLAVDAAINQDLKALSVIDKNALDPNYLYYWYLSVAEDVVAQGSGATVQGVKLITISRLLIPLPSVEVQQEIADKLDSFSALISSIQNLNEKLSNESEALQRTFMSQLLEANDE